LHFGNILLIGLINITKTKKDQEIVQNCLKNSLGNKKTVNDKNDNETKNSLTNETFLFNISNILEKFIFKNLKNIN
jgi:hypothetical protein